MKRTKNVLKYIQDKPDWALQKDGRSKSMASMSEAPRLSESEQVCNS